MRKWGRRAAHAAAERPAGLLIGHDLDGFLAGIRAKRRTGAPLIYDSHELFPDYASSGRPAYERRGWILYESRLIRHADQVIAVTPGRGDVMASRYGIPKPLIIRNMPETAERPAQPAARLRQGVPDGSSVIFYSGGLQPTRGLEQLIAALEHLPSCVLAVIGLRRAGLRRGSARTRRGGRRRGEDDPASAGAPSRGGGGERRSRRRRGPQPQRKPEQLAQPSEQDLRVPRGGDSGRREPLARADAARRPVRGRGNLRSGQAHRHRARDRRGPRRPRALRTATRERSPRGAGDDLGE